MVITVACDSYVEVGSAYCLQRMFHHDSVSFEGRVVYINILFCGTAMGLANQLVRIVATADRSSEPS